MDTAQTQPTEGADTVDTEDPTIPFLPSFAKPTERRQRTPLILDLSFLTFLSLSFTPKALANANGVPTLSDHFSHVIRNRSNRSRRANDSGRDERTEEYELEERLLGRNENVESGLPLPFNLGSTPSRSTRTPRANRPSNTIPGALGADW